MASLALLAFSIGWAAQPVGVLILAHGGSSKWDKEIFKVKKELEKAGYLAEVALGMADNRTIRKAMESLEARGVDGIVAVPLLVNSNSELYDQFRFVLGLSFKPSEDFLEGLRSNNLTAKRWSVMNSKGEEEKKKRFTIRMLWEKNKHEHGHTAMEVKQVTAKHKIRLTQAFDAHPLIAEILLDRAKKLSRNPQDEVIVLVSHGPYTDSREPSWMGPANALAQQLKDLGGFSDVKAFNLRDDSPKEIKERKAKELREYVRSNIDSGKKVIVIPHLVSMNGIEKHIREALDGLFYKMGKEAILPHPNVARWVIEMAKKANNANEAKE